MWINKNGEDDNLIYISTYSKLISAKAIDKIVNKTLTNTVS